MVYVYAVTVERLVSAGTYVFIREQGLDCHPHVTGEHGRIIHGRDILHISLCNRNASTSAPFVYGKSQLQLFITSGLILLRQFCKNNGRSSLNDYILIRSFAWISIVLTLLRVFLLISTSFDKLLHI